MMRNPAGVVPVPGWGSRAAPWWDGHKPAALWLAEDLPRTFAALKLLCGQYLVELQMSRKNANLIQLLIIIVHSFITRLFNGCTSVQNNLQHLQLGKKMKCDCIIGDCTVENSNYYVFQRFYFLNLFLNLFPIDKVEDLIWLCSPGRTGLSSGAAVVLPCDPAALLRRVMCSVHYCCHALPLH